MTQHEINFSQRLRDLRLTAGLSGVELAAKVGLQGASIVLMEKGRRKPSYDVLGKLADVFGCQVDYLMGREAPEPPPKWLADLLPDLEALDKRGQESVKALVRGLKKT